MSFDEYVHHISQKHRLAVAISVIKTKPNDLSIEDFLMQLQRKINMESDPNETVCSDDFNFDEDANQQRVSEEVNNVNIIKSNEKLIHPENEDSQMSQTISADFVIENIGRHESDAQKETSVIGDTLKLLKETTGNVNQQQDSSQLRFCESQTGTVINDSSNTFCYSTVNGFIMATPESNTDSQATKLYTSHRFTHDYTHVSQTQDELFFISDNFIKNTNRQDNMVHDTDIITGNTEHKNQNKTVPTVNNNINDNINKNEYNPNVTNTFENAENENDTCDNIEECHEMLVEEGTDSDDEMQTVKVPFKILEELNKVKSYLNKRDRRNTEGYSTDSGYRSDSHLRCFFKTSSQNTQSGVWLNQSAHCLFTYITQAPTVTDDITKEVSQVLGQLIDRLHEEENCPSFLEDLLEAVNNLIKEIHEGGSWDNHMLLTKDENMYHLNLLNKSQHILRHSIGNITNILEKLHTNLTQEDLYELTNTAEIENVCYVFHTLEIFLKRYLKLKNASSKMRAQNSQEDVAIAKRSSLTDLWRKKWNPNYRETTKTHESETTCVVKKCSAVLNKIIVECMDGYSLISYAALQCFNMIQS